MTEQLALVPEDATPTSYTRVPEGCTSEDIDPRGGTLVLFDSVALPHEVRETLQGQRVALAGWLHEAVQPFPSWYHGGS